MKPVHETIITIRPRWRKKSLGIRFDMLAFFRMLEEFGIGLGEDVSQISKVPYDDLISVAIFTGAESYCFHHNLKKWYTKEDVLKWVDDSKITRGHMKEIGSLWADFMQDFIDSQKKTKMGKA